MLVATSLSTQLRTQRAIFFYLAFFALTIHGKDDGIVFQEEDSSVDLKFIQTSAMSKVTDWDVFLESSTTVLGVESFVPVSESGFWIVGFKSRSLKEIHDMISILGQVKMLDKEDRGGFCSNLPYFYNYTIEDILERHSLYKEDNSGNPLSIFDWRSRPPYNPVVTADGNQYEKTALKSMSASLKTLMNCMNTSREYKDGTFYFKKTLFHTYIRVKDNCLDWYRFEVSRCVEMFERTTLLIWKLSSHVIVLSSVASTAHQWVTQRHAVTAQEQHMKFFQFSSPEGVDMVEGEVTLNLTFSLADNEYYFYLPSSFNITGPYLLGSEGLMDWELLNVTSVNLTRPVGHVTGREGVSVLDSNNITPEVYTKYLAGKTFPISLLPRSLTDSVLVQFKVVNGLNKTSDKITVKQDFGFISCNSAAEDRMCKFGRSVTTISTGIAINVESKTQVYTAETEVEWSVNLISISAGDTENSTGLTSGRPLYATEPLLVRFSISPKYVLKEKTVQLMYLTLSLLPRSNSSFSYLIYQNPKYEAESPPHLAEFQDRQQDSYGRFTCSDTKIGECSLVIQSEVFSSSPSGDYALLLALKLEGSEHVQRRKRATLNEDSIIRQKSSTKSFELDFKYVGSPKKSEIESESKDRRSHSWLYQGSSWLCILGSLHCFYRFL